VGTFVPAGYATGQRLCYANPAPSTAIANTAAETAFDQYFTFPSQAQRSTQPVTVIRLKAYGVYSTGLINLGLTLRVRWGGVAGTLVCSSGSLTLGASASNSAWSTDVMLLIQSIGSIGSMEGQGSAVFTVGSPSVTALGMGNSGAFSVDTTVASDIVITAQWAIAAAANTIQMRACVVDFDGP
jgi:hypothetical protein